jgi:hypothetical protein
MMRAHVGTVTFTKRFLPKAINAGTGNARLESPNTFGLETGARCPLRELDFSGSRTASRYFERPDDLSPRRGCRSFSALAVNYVQHRGK